MAAELERKGIEPLLIGAAALAAHGYARSTEDIDFGVAIPTAEFRELFLHLERSGFRGRLNEADGADPLGGVVTLEEAQSRPVQIINFDNSPAGGFPALVRSAEQRAAKLEGLPGKLVTPEDLVLFKLYAGGPKSHLDIVELLTRVELDLDALRRDAIRFRLDRQLERILASLNE